LALAVASRARRCIMIAKSPLCPERVRKITGSLAFLEHRF